MFEGLSTPVLGVAAFSGTGKTTLLRQVLPRLTAAGLAVGVIKHTHHDFEVDRPGKDSHVLRQAGARQTLLAGPHRWALIAEEPEHRGDPDLEELVHRLDLDRLDLVLVEGFRHAPFPKLELHRAALGRSWLYPEDPWIVAVASDTPPPEPCRLPCLDLNRPDQVAAFVLDWAGRRRAGG